MPRSQTWLKLGLIVLCGCAGYRWGTRSLYAPDVTTVYVPMIESDSFRPHLGEWLTEAVVKEIELKTPYKVVASGDADSVLSARIVSETKRILVEDAFDQPREVETQFSVQVHWLDRRGALIRQPEIVPLSASLVRFGQTASLVAEGGQSIATAHGQAVHRLAEQIVATMEAPW